MKGFPLLMSRSQVEHPEYLIRTSLRYSMFDLAVDYAIDMITRVRFCAFLSVHLLHNSG